MERVEFWKRRGRWLERQSFNQFGSSALQTVSHLGKGKFSNKLTLRGIKSVSKEKERVLFYSGRNSHLDWGNDFGVAGYGSEKARFQSGESRLQVYQRISSQMFVTCNEQYRRHAMKGQCSFTWGRFFFVFQIKFFFLVLLQFSWSFFETRISLLLLHIMFLEQLHSARGLHP